MMALSGQQDTQQMASTKQKFSTNRSAWKKELEKKLFENGGKSIDHHQSKTEHNRASWHKPIVKEHSNPSHQPDINNKKAAPVKEQILAARQLPNQAASVSHNVISQDSVRIFKPVSTLNSIQQIEGIRAAPDIVRTNSQQTLDLSHNVRLNTNNTDQTTIRYFNIKLLPDGEMIIKNHTSGGLSINQLDNLVKELKSRLGNNISKLKINGNTIWKADVNSTPLTSTSIINLIY